MSQHKKVKHIFPLTETVPAPCSLPLGQAPVREVPCWHLLLQAYTAARQVQCSPVRARALEEDSEFLKRNLDNLEASEGPSDKRLSHCLFHVKQFLKPKSTVLDKGNTTSSLLLKTLTMGTSKCLGSWREEGGDIQFVSLKEWYRRNLPGLCCHLHEAPCPRNKDNKM